MSKSEPFYTEAQALRGKVAFNRNCAACHSVDPKRAGPGGDATTDTSVRESITGGLNSGLPASFGGGHFFERVYLGKLLYPSVYYLFRKLDSMPAFDTQAVNPQSKADIVAYILASNGFPAGAEELTPDPEVMKAMMTNEPGFEHVFNGRDFTGLKFNIGPNCKPQPVGCGKTEPGPELRVENHMMVCACNVHGHWYTEKKYHDFTLRFQERFVRPAGWDEHEELFHVGGGFLLFITEHRVWPNGIEVEGRYDDRLYIWDVRGKSQFTYDVKAKDRANRPMDQWSDIEIVSKNGQVKSFLNGTLVSTVTSHPYREPGHIGFQMEGGASYWRNIRIRQE